jgi:hypothetical protein
MNSRRSSNRPPREMPPPTSGLAPQHASLTGGNRSANTANTATAANTANAASEPLAAAAPVSPAAPRRSGRANGTTRSWYLPHAVANDLAAAADGLYFDLRGSREKAEILGVLIRVGLNNLPKVRKQLGLPPSEEQAG